MSLFSNLKVTPETIRKSSEWFKRKIKDLHLQTFPHNIGYAKYNKPMIGHMFLFNYDAKFKYELPYWDTYPLVLPFNIKGDRFWGLNLHYLPYEYRLQLLGGLSKLITDSKISEQQKFQISWQILESTARMNLVKPCVHSYLMTGNHIQSNLMMIKSEEWFNAILMPLERFESRDRNASKEKYIKYDKHKVWNDSLKRP